MLKYSKNINIRLLGHFISLHKIINHISQTAYIQNIRIILHIYTLYRSNETIIGGRPSTFMRMKYKKGLQWDKVDGCISHPTDQGN